MHFSKNLTLDLAMFFFVPFLNIRSGNVLLLSSLTCASGYVLLSYALSLDLDMFYCTLLSKMSQLYVLPATGNDIQEKNTIIFLTGLCTRCVYLSFHICLFYFISKCYVFLYNFVSTILVRETCFIF
jgi:hypothetical protein